MRDPGTQNTVKTNDRELVYIQSLPELFQTLPKLSQGLPELRQSLPQLTQTSTASSCCPSYRTTFFCFFFRDLRNRIVLFESVFGRSLSKRHFKTIGFR